MREHGFLMSFWQQTESTTSIDNPMSPAAPPVATL